LTGVTPRQHNPDGSGEPEPTVTRIRPGRAIPTPAEDAARLLLQSPRSIPPKYFYNARGSTLFDAITETPEYYPTRTERALLEFSAPRIMALARPDHVLELGSGSSSKTRELLDAWDAPRGGKEARRYWPFDVSESVLSVAAAALRREYAELTVSPLAGDYSGGLANFPVMKGRVLVVFLGGTIGNFSRGGAIAFLAELAHWMDQDDSLLIGFDRVKDVAVLEAAYNDAAGLTAEFNLNILRVLNRALGADFDTRVFSHQAIYNQDADQIEMYLVSKSDQIVSLEKPEATLELQAGEKILTEISRKFTPEAFSKLLEASGFELSESFEPDDGYFSPALARVRSP
jgi:L-histidine N-alpha-methyltransferase